MLIVGRRREIGIEIERNVVEIVVDAMVARLGGWRRGRRSA